MKNAIGILIGIALQYTSPSGLQSQTFWGTHLPGAGPPCWGAQTPHSLGRTSAIVIILPLSFSGGVGLDYIASPPLLLILLWFLLCVFSCGKSFLLVSRVILIDSCSVNSCNFGVPTGGGKVRDPLLCHLGHTSISSYFYF